MAFRFNLRPNPYAAISALMRHKLVAWLAVTCAVLAGAGFFAITSEGGLLGSRADAATTTTTYTPDPEGLLDGRSPGQRRYGWLLDNKPDRLAFSAGDPGNERVLSSTRRRPGGDPVAPVVPAVPLTSLGVIPDTTGAMADLGDPGIPGLVGGGVGGAPIIGGVGGPGGGGGGGGGTPTDPGTPGTPAPAVPEPATWAMLVLGFAMLGIAMRRRRPVPVATTR